MKRLVGLILMMAMMASAAFSQTAEQVSLALARRGELDEIRWMDPTKGPAFRVALLRATESGLEVRRGTVNRLLTYDQIGGVKFGMTMGEFQILSAARPEAIPALQVIWEARRRTIAIPGSNVGDFGLALARASRQSGDLEAAISIAREIAEHDLDSERQSRAKAESETLAFLQGMKKETPEEIEKRAWSVTEAADESNPELMLLATGFLRVVEFDALKQIESENPRWFEDDEIKPQRDRHYNLALDLALYPSLFHPLHESESADGLWQAVQVYLHTRETERAVSVLEDLLALYADSVHTAKAGELFTSLKGSLASEKPAAEPDPKEEPAPEPAGPPPPPKRYNLFED